MFTATNVCKSITQYKVPPMSDKKLKSKIFINLIFKEDIYLIKDIDKFRNNSIKTSRTSFVKQAIKEKINKIKELKELQEKLKNIPK